MNCIATLMLNVTCISRFTSLLEVIVMYVAAFPQQKCLQKGHLLSGIWLQTSHHHCMQHRVSALITVSLCLVSIKLLCGSLIQTGSNGSKQRPYRRHDTATQSLCSMSVCWIQSCALCVHQDNVSSHQAIPEIMEAIRIRCIQQTWMCVICLLFVGVDTSGRACTQEDKAHIWNFWSWTS